jgi:hypothetical protein
MLGLQAYGPATDIRAKFPGADMLLADYGDAVPSFAAFWEDFVQMITNRTTQGLNAKDVPSSIQTYAELFRLADALGRSRFLKTLVSDHNLLTKNHKERAEKLKWRFANMSAASRTLSREPSGSSRFPTVGSRTILLAWESVHSILVIVLTMLYRMDLTNLLCHQRLWTNSTSTSLPSQ